MIKLEIGANAKKPQTKGAWHLTSGFDELLGWLVPCQDQTEVHISRSCICSRFAIRGVPARSVDVCVDRRILEQSADDLPMVLTRSAKSGKYDHSLRDRWLIRRMNGQSVMNSQMPDAEVIVTASTASVGIRVIVGDLIASRADYDRLPPIDHSYDQIACVKRNWTRYFRHICWESDVTPRLDEYVPFIVQPGDTISELNMHASRWLADVSVSLGWHRVIAPAAARRGLPLWHRDDVDDSASVDDLERVQERLEVVR